MNLFPIQLGVARGAFAVVVLSVFTIAVNALLWFGAAFLIAYAATKGYYAAT